DLPLTATLHYLRDFLSYGTDHPNSSSFNGANHDQNGRNLSTTQKIVHNLVTAQGEALVQRILTGMMFTFPRDCFQDASGVLLELFEVEPEKAAIWVKNTIAMLPPGSVKSGDGDRLMDAIDLKIRMRDMRKVRVLLQG
ncbi:MAG: hypothetical protein Q9187_009349, partial [Circinaria calcarea]